MDLTRTTARELGSALDRIGISWSYDADGDVRVRFRSSRPPATDVVFYEFDTDFSIRGQFLNARATPQSNGQILWEVPLGSGRQPTAVAQKVVTVYLMPRPGHVEIQIYASVDPIGLARPVRILLVPEGGRVRRIEMEFPGFVGNESDKQFWMSTFVEGGPVSDSDFGNLINAASKVGLAMFDTSFRGWMQIVEE